MQENCFNTQITFDQMPQAMAYLINKVEKLESLLIAKQPEAQESDRWFNLEELRQYHPDHPAAPTVYAWVGQRQIPNHKHGKKLMFLKSEIDAWLKTGKRKTSAEIEAEAQQFVTNNGRAKR
jgi:predicted DNA-binding transcriptional regulator AlpA